MLCRKISRPPRANRSTPRRLIYALLLSRGRIACAPRSLPAWPVACRSRLPEKTAALFPEVSASRRPRAAAAGQSRAAAPCASWTPASSASFRRRCNGSSTATARWKCLNSSCKKSCCGIWTRNSTARAKPTVQFYTLKPLVPDCAVVLSALANVGSSDADEIQKAFDTGAPLLRAPENSGLALLPVGQCGIDRLDAALNRLALAVPIIKKNLLEACAHVVGADGVIVENEAELLRAIADTLDCPMPPMGV